MGVGSPGQPVPRRQRHPADRDRPIASALSLPEEHVDVIEQSHERCVALGLSRIERPDFSPLSRSDLTVARERNLRLHGHAAPVMEMLHEQIVNTGSMVVLSDATGTVIHSVGDDDFLQRAGKVALAPGANWSEASKGTNAVGTALISERPTLVHADEHFLHANHFLTCSAAPILDPRGNILGVLDVSGDHRSYHQHTMALVKMSARMIENQWLVDNYRHAMRLHFHGKLGFIGSLMEGILAVSPEGRLLGANRSALEQLTMSSAALRMQSLVSLFGTSVGALVDHFRSPLAAPLQVRMGDGREFHMHARFNWPVWSQVAEAAERAVTGANLVPPGGAGRSQLAMAADGVATPPATAREAAATSLATSSATPLPTAAVASRGEAAGLSTLATGDPQVDTLIGKLRRVIDRDIPILLIGETGTGKEMLARAIHAESSRADKPFVAVNCASIPETLIEAELFGYDEGAFTGARRKGSLGKIQQAHGGTLFLDEIGDMPLALQAHLLRVLQERQVTPLGSLRSVSVDVAIICATHQNLREMIEARTFRQDLYYRLNGLALRLPALRERSDLGVLVARILESGLGRHLGLSTEAHALMHGYDWPGNIRQLYNVLRTAAVMAGTERWIRPEHLPEDFLDELRLAKVRSIRAPASGMPDPATAVAGGSALMASRGDPSVGAVSAVDASGDPASAGTGEPAHGRLSSADGQAALAPRPLHEVEREAIERAVAEAGGNISVAAKQLGVSRNTIYRRLRWNKPSSA